MIEKCQKQPMLIPYKSNLQLLKMLYLVSFRNKRKRLCCECEFFISMY